jgi:hypothetical protein
MPNVPENVAMDYHKAHLEGKEAEKVGGGSTVAGVGAAPGIAQKGAAGATGSAAAAAAVKGGGPKLSQELQLYFTRLTRALLPGGGEAASVAVGKDGELSSPERARLAALASLRGDTGLQGLVVYLVRWIGEKITESLSHLSNLPPLLDTIHALLSNQTLFLEPLPAAHLPARFRRCHRKRSIILSVALRAVPIRDPGSCLACARRARERVWKRVRNAHSS